MQNSDTVTTHFSNAQKNWVLFIALLMTPLSGATIDIYVPSLPAIHHYFRVSNTLVQLTVAVYLFGYGILQIVFGTMSDIFGRKKLLLISLPIYIIVSLLAPFSPNIGILLLLRFLQGVFIAAPGVLNKSLLSDVYAKENLMKYSNYITIAWALGPIIAPVIGGYLQHYYGWHAPFYFLAGYGFITLLTIILLLPETHYHRTSPHLSDIKRNFKIILTNKVFIGTIMLLSLTYAFITVFNVVGPFLVQVVLHQTAIVYGHLALLLGVAWFAGNLLNRYLVKRNVNHYKLIIINTYILITITTIMVVATFFIKISLVSIIVPTILLLFSASMIFPNALGINVSLFTQISGSSNAFMGSFFVLGSGLASAIASIFKSNSEIPLAIIYFSLALLCCLAYYGLIKNK